MKLNKLIVNLEIRHQEIYEREEMAYQAHANSFGDHQNIVTRDIYSELVGRRKEISEIINMLKMAKELGAED